MVNLNFKVNPTQAYSRIMGFQKEVIQLPESNRRRELNNIASCAIQYDSFYTSSMREFFGYVKTETDNILPKEIILFNSEESVERLVFFYLKALCDHIGIRTFKMITDSLLNIFEDYTDTPSEGTHPLLTDIEIVNILTTPFVKRVVKEIGNKKAINIFKLNTFHKSFNAVSNP